MTRKWRPVNRAMCLTIVSGLLLAGCSSQSTLPPEDGNVVKAPKEPGGSIETGARPDPPVRNGGAMPTPANGGVQPTFPSPQRENAFNQTDSTPPVKKSDDLEVVKKLETAYRILIQSGDRSPDFRSGLQSLAEKMQELPVAIDDAPLKWAAVNITQISPYPNEEQKPSMAVFKFRSPLDVPADMHWSYAVPEAMGRWYILPVKGTMNGFESFHFTRNLNIPALPLSLGSLFVFQELMQGRILPDQEYIVWYIPAQTPDTRMFAGIRLTPAGSRPPGKNADEIRASVNVETRPVEFPQTPAGLGDAFEMAARMTSFNPIDKDGVQQILRSVWPLIPEINVATNSKSPIWNHLAPNIAPKFHAVRFKSALSQAADMNWAFVVPGELIRAGVMSKEEPSPAPETYWLEVDLPIREISNPEKNLVVLQSVVSESLVPDSEHVIWFAPTAHKLPDVDVAVRLSPAGAVPAADDGKSIGRELGLEVPDIPSAERVAAAFERCSKLVRDKNTMGWQFHRLLDFAAPAIPWLDTNDDTSHWNKVDLSPADKKFAAFRVGQTDSRRARVIVAVAHLHSNIGTNPIDVARAPQAAFDAQRLSCGFVFPNLLGYHGAQRRRQLGLVLPGLQLPPDREVHVDVMDDGNFEKQQPLILVLAAKDDEPLAFHVAGRVIADPDTDSPVEIVSAIEQMGLKVNSSGDLGGVMGEHDHLLTMMRFIGNELLVTGSLNGAGSRLKRDSNRSFIVWDTKSQKEAASQDFESGSMICAVSADGTRVAAMRPYSGIIKIFDVSAPEKSIELQSPENRATMQLEFSADGKSLSGCYNGDKYRPERQSFLYVWDLQNPGLPRVHEFPRGMLVRAACELPSGQLVAVGNRKGDTQGLDQTEFRRRYLTEANRILAGTGELQFLDRETFKVVDTIKEEGAEWAAVSVSADGSRIAALASSGLAMVWDTKTHEPIATVPENHSGQALQLSADGHRLAALNGGGAARVWDLDSRRILRQWPAGKPEFTKIAISPSGELLALGGADRKVRMFSTVSDGKSPSDIPAEMTDSVGIKLNLLPAGEFIMGKIQLGVPIYKAPGNPREADQEPNHNVQLTKPFYMGRYEVTVAQFREFVKATDYRTTAETNGIGGSHIFSDNEGFKDRPNLNWKNPGFPQQDNHPVVQVSWNDAKAFCEWLSKKENAPYHLPTEAQWEYACRAGTTTAFYHGTGHWITKCANIPDAELVKAYGSYGEATSQSDGYAYTAPVGSLVPNGFGLFDMHGNVWEWCADWYDAKYYANSPTDDPQGPKEGQDHVQRGGGFLAGPAFSYWRDVGPPDQTQSHLGFRVVRELP